MIINASARTDIPAYFSEWLINRLKAGYVYVRNPYYPTQITEYSLNQDVVDSIIFCTKNPRPILPYLNELKKYHPYFFITITPYGKEIEPQVPRYQEVIQDFQKISKQLGKKSVCLRYDPIFINEIYTVEKHKTYFKEMIEALDGYTEECVISFIDLYAKTKRNFPHIQEVTLSQIKELSNAFSEVAQKHHIQLKTCAEDIDLSEYRITQEGCITKKILQDVIGIPVRDQKSQPLRKGCHCYPSRDIGEYNTCMHGCLYCYANEDKKEVNRKYQKHDPLSPLLIGYVEKGDIIKHAKQESLKERQLSLDI